MASEGMASEGMASVKSVVTSESMCTMMTSESMCTIMTSKSMLASETVVTKVTPVMGSVSVWGEGMGVLVGSCVHLHNIIIIGIKL